MGKRYLIDTNVIIDYSSNLLPSSGSSFLENIFNSDFNISVIVKIETLGFNKEPEKMNLLEEFLSTANIYPLDNITAQTTIDLKKASKLRLGDAIIAATALLQNFVLITRNVDDFKNIQTLEILNPHKIS